MVEVIRDNFSILNFFQGFSSLLEGILEVGGELFPDFGVRLGLWVVGDSSMEVQEG